MKIRRVLIYEGPAKVLLSTMRINAVQGQVQWGETSVREEELTILEREAGTCMSCGKRREEHHSFHEFGEWEEGQ